MGVEFSKITFSGLGNNNPFARGKNNELPTLITGSVLKQEVAKTAKIPVANEKFRGLLLPITDRAEARTQGQIIHETGNHHVILPPKREPNSPISVLELATDKAQAAAQSILKQIKVNPFESYPQTIVCVDSAWGLGDFLNFNHPVDPNHFLLQKPKDQIGIELIIENLKQAADLGWPIQSVSGICVVYLNPSDPNNPLEYNQSLMVVNYGVVNPNFPWDYLANKIKKNGHYAAGFSSTEIFHDPLLVSFNRFFDAWILNYGRRKNKRIPNGAFINSGHILRVYSDITNLPFIIASSLGLIPQN